MHCQSMAFVISPASVGLFDIQRC